MARPGHGALRLCRDAPAGPGPAEGQRPRRPPRRSARRRRALCRGGVRDRARGVRARREPGAASPARSSARPSSQRSSTPRSTAGSPRAAAPIASAPASPRSLERRARPRSWARARRRTCWPWRPPRSHLHERPLRARRRGDHARGRLPHHGRAALPARAACRSTSTSRRTRTTPRSTPFADAIGPRTRGVVAAHCLGNPFDAPALAALCREHDLVLIEDCCDALGSRIGGRLVGTFGEAATYSFYPAHHMTTGEGGAVACDDDDVGARDRLAARVGARLLVPDRASKDVCGRRFDGRFGVAAGRLRPQVRLLARRLQLQDHRHAGRAGRRPDSSGWRLRRARRRANFDAPACGARSRSRTGVVLPRALPEADPSGSAIPFTLRDGGAAARRALQLHLLQRRDRLAAAARREHDAPAGLSGPRSPIDEAAGDVPTA